MKSSKTLYIEPVVSHSYLQPLEDLASSLVTGRGDEGLENMASRGVCGQCQQVSGGQGAQTAEEQWAIFEFGQRLDQPGAMVTDGGQRNLEKIRNGTNRSVCSTNTVTRCHGIKTVS